MCQRVVHKNPDSPDYADSRSLIIKGARHALRLRPQTVNKIVRALIAALSSRIGLAHPAWYRAIQMSMSAGARTEFGAPGEISPILRIRSPGMFFA